MRRIGIDVGGTNTDAVLIEEGDLDAAEATENVLDIAQRAGVHVLWLDNNSSSKGVAERVPYLDCKKPERNPVCDAECRDEGMLRRLQDWVDERPEGDLLQAWGWGSCTALAGEPPIRILVEDGGAIRGVAQVLMRSAPFGKRVAYVPHGPLWDRSAPDADRTFAWLIQGLRTLARKEKAIVVKMDPRAEPGENLDFARLAAAHDLRRAPELRFSQDIRAQQGQRISALLDKSAPGSNEPSTGD